MPGTSAREAMTTITGEFPDLVHLPELPMRGPGGDMIGRAITLLSQVSEEFSVDTMPTGWRLADTPGIAVRRALSFLGEDLDHLEEFCGETNARVKIQLAGPITLAASVTLRRGERVLADEGALRDLVHAHQEAVARHIAEVRRRLPSAALVLQIDEPSLDAALQGSLRTQSGYGRHMPLDEPQVRAWHRELVALVRGQEVTPWLHSCAPHWPLDLARDCGYAAVSGDFSYVRDRDDDVLGMAVESGMDIVCGVIPTDDAALARNVRNEAATVEPIRARYQRLGFDDRVLARTVVITPTCGLGACSWPSARTAMRRVRAAAHVLADQLEGADA